MSSRLLILDLDETLIFASETPFSDRPADHHAAPYHVYRRPHLSEFLTTVARWYDLAIWSSASAAYVSSIASHLFPDPTALRFIWSSDRCTRRYDPEQQDYFYAKNLDKVAQIGFPLDHILMIDDSPEKLRTHYGNLLRLTPFIGSPTHTDLQSVLPFLNHLRTADNLRRIEKRTWRAFRPPTPPSS